VTAVSIEARGLTHRYATRVGLATVDFSIEAPGVVAVTGPNGSGKSTLLRIIAGLLRPTGGTLRVAREGRTWSPESRRLSMGFVSPDVTLYEEMTVEENLRFAAEARGLTDAMAARTAMARVHLMERAGDLIGALSSGWRQRARLAFALLGDPPLLLLDEPGSHLDESGRAVVESLVGTSRQERLVVIATNDEREWMLGERRIDLAGGTSRPR